MTYDAIVVGGSYAGLSAAMQLARARRSVLVIDAGRPRNRFAERAHGFLGQDGVAPPVILDEAARQLRAYPTAELVRDEVVLVGGSEGDFVVTLAGGFVDRARRLVLATGLADELPPIPGLQERWGRTVLHCLYCHGYELGGGRLGVLANHPLSTHQAVLITDLGPTTYFTQGAFEPDPEAAARLAARGVTIERTPVVELLGTSPGLDAVRLRDGRTVPLGGLFTAPRLRMASPEAKQLGCAIGEGPLGPFVRVDDWKQTTVKGVYAAGDAASWMHNVSVASASGVTAGIGAHQSLAGSVIAKPASADAGHGLGSPCPRAAPA